MKTRANKFVTFFFSFVIILQSCGTYKQQTISVNQAVALKEPVKIITHKDQKLKFKGLTYQDSILVGVTKDVKTLQKLNLYVPTENEDPFRRVKLRESAIKSIHQKREKSNLVLQTIGTVLTVGATIYFLTHSALDEASNFIDD